MVFLTFNNITIRASFKDGVCHSLLFRTLGNTLLVDLSSSSLLSIVSDDDIIVGFRPLHALLVGERIVQFEM